MNRSEELERLMTETTRRFGEIVTASLQEIEEVNEEANAKVRRYEEARESLENVEGRIAALEAEREALPERVTRANLDEDFDLELQLRDRYRELPSALERLERHRDALRAELAQARTDPAHPDPEFDSLRVRSRQSARTSGAAFVARADLQGFRSQLAEALADLSEPLEDRWRSARGGTETLNSLIDDRTRGRRVLG